MPSQQECAGKHGDDDDLVKAQVKHIATPLLSCFICNSSGQMLLTHSKI